MALVFPRAMPLLGASTNLFEPDRADFMNREASGRLGAMAAGFPIWRGEWTLGQAISRELSDEWRAFVASLDGAARLFYGYDVERRVPKAHPNLSAEFGGWNGQAGGWSQAIGGDGQAVLAMTGIIPGVKLGLGDYVGFRWTTGGQQRRALVRCIEAAAASGGGVLAVTVTPAVPTVVPGDAIAYLIEPNCLMRIDPRQTSISAMDRRAKVGARIVAYQDLLP